MWIVDKKDTKIEKIDGFDDWIYYIWNKLSEIKAKHVLVHTH